MNTKKIQAQVEQIVPLTDSIMQLILAPDEYVEYQAGQYLKIILGDEALCYSIANAPLGSHKYELHIRHSADNPYNKLLFAQIKKQGALTISLPYGACSIEHLDSKSPIIFIAGGTGFAPVKAMIEQLLASGVQRSFELYWGARSKSDLYMDELVRSWAAHVSHFNYYSLISATRKKTLASSMLANHPNDYNKWQIVISGPFDMVHSTRDELVSKGVSKEQLFSDQI